MDSSRHPSNPQVDLEGFLIPQVEVEGLENPLVEVEGLPEVQYVAIPASEADAALAVCVAADIYVKIVELESSTSDQLFNAFATLKEALAYLDPGAAP